jgi:hypothetical protein
MAAKKENATIELPRLDVQLMEITLVGDTPLIVHAWSTKARREMLGKQMKKAKGAKEAKDPQQDFADSLYKLADGGYGFPSVAFKNAAVTAVTSVAGLTKVETRQAFHVLGEDLEVDAALDGLKVRQNLARIEGSEPRIREDMVRVGMGTADIRYRGEYWPWFTRILVRFNGNVLSAEQLLNLLNTAGFGVGVGEWRPERDGSYGTFHVAGEGEVEKLMRAAR